MSAECGTWTVLVRADGRTDIDALMAFRRLRRLHLGGRVVALRHDARSLSAEVVVDAPTGRAACETVVTRVKAELNGSWMVGAVLRLPDATPGHPGVRHPFAGAEA